MPVTTVDLPQGLVDQAKEALGERTAKATITRALEDVVRRQAQLDALDNLAGADHLAGLLDPHLRAAAAR